MIEQSFLEKYNSGPIKTIRECLPKGEEEEIAMTRGADIVLPQSLGSLSDVTLDGQEYYIYAGGPSMPDDKVDLIMKLTQPESAADAWLNFMEEQSAKVDNVYEHIQLLTDDIISELDCAITETEKVAVKFRDGVDDTDDLAVNIALKELVYIQTTPGVLTKACDKIIKDYELDMSVTEVKEKIVQIKSRDYSNVMGKIQDKVNYYRNNNTNYIPFPAGSISVDEFVEMVKKDALTMLSSEESLVNVRVNSEKVMQATLSQIQEALMKERHSMDCEVAVAKAFAVATDIGQRISVFNTMIQNKWKDAKDDISGAATYCRELLINCKDQYSYLKSWWNNSGMGKFASQGNDEPEDMEDYISGMTGRAPIALMSGKNIANTVGQAFIMAAVGVGKVIGLLFKEGVKLLAKGIGKVNSIYDNPIDIKPLYSDGVDDIVRFFHQKRSCQLRHGSRYMDYKPFQYTTYKDIEGKTMTFDMHFGVVQLTYEDSGTDGRTNCTVKFSPRVTARKGPSTSLSNPEGGYQDDRYIPKEPYFAKYFYDYHPIVTMGSYLVLSKENLGYAERQLCKNYGTIKLLAKMQYLDADQDMTYTFDTIGSWGELTPDQISDQARIHEKRIWNSLLINSVYAAYFPYYFMQPTLEGGIPDFPDSPTSAGLFRNSLKFNESNGLGYELTNLDFAGMLSNHMYFQHNAITGWAAFGLWCYEQRFEHGKFIPFLLNKDWPQGRLGIISDDTHRAVAERVTTGVVLGAIILASTIIIRTSIRKVLRNSSIRLNGARRRLEDKVTQGVATASDYASYNRIRRRHNMKNALLGSTAGQFSFSMPNFLKGDNSSSPSLAENDKDFLLSIKELIH